MNKFKLFIENFLVYGLGGIVSKAIPLIMVPIVTRIIPGTEYFGISDLSNTIVQFGCAIALMGMYDAMYRMFFERDDETYKKVVCSTALSFTICSSIFIFLLMIILKDFIAIFVFKNGELNYVVILSAIATLVGATNSIISAPTRMQNNKIVYLIANALGPLFSYAIAIPLLLYGHYIIALPVAAILSGLFLEISFSYLNHRWFTIRLIDKKVLKQLLKIGLPLMPNFLIYWVFTSCDRLMITDLLGLSFEGIYSVGSKLGNCSQLIYLAFAGGWQYFAFATMKEEGQVRSNSKVFEYLGILSFTATSFICAWSFGIFRILFKMEYLSGFIVAPYLFLSPLLHMLFQVIANQFLVVKKTWPSGVMLLCGAITNIILNIVLIPLFGIEGAAMATLAGYIVTIVVCSATLIKIGLMKIDREFFFSFLIFSIFFIVWRIWFTTNMLIGTILAISATISFGYIYRKDLGKILLEVKRRDKE